MSKQADSHLLRPGSTATALAPPQQPRARLLPTEPINSPGHESRASDAAGRAREGGCLAGAGGRQARRGTRDPSPTVPPPHPPMPMTDAAESSQDSSVCHCPLHHVRIRALGGCGERMIFCPTAAEAGGSASAPALWVRLLRDSGARRTQKCPRPHLPCLTLFPSVLPPLHGSHVSTSHSDHPPLRGQ